MEPDLTPPNVFPELQTGPAAPRRQQLWRRRSARIAPSLAWYQFTVRRLLLLVLIISLPLAWLGRQGVRHVQRRRAAAHIVALGGNVHWRTNPVENTWRGDDLIYVSDVGIHNARFPTAALGYLRELPGLRGVGLSSSQFDDATLDALAGLRDVNHVSLGSPSMTDAGLARLTALPNLRSVTLVGPQFTDAAVAHLARLPHLESLMLENVRMTGAGMSRLRGCPTIRAIMVDGPWFNGSCLDGPRGMKKLSALHLCNSSLAPADFGRLQGQPNLVYLRLTGTSIVDGCLKPLRRAPSVSVLDLQNTSLTAAGLADLRGVRLRGLNLLGNEFDDASIGVVESLPLARFGTSSNRISDAAIARLKRAKPKLQIIEWRKQ